MNNMDLCQQLLAIPGPWRVQRFEVNARERRLDVWVGQDSPSAGKLLRKMLGKQEAAPGMERVWRHLNAGNYRTFVHSAEAPSHSEPFLGTDEVPFTNAMAERISGLLSEGTSYRTICTVMDVEFKDVWQLKATRHRGRESVAAVNRARAEAEVATAGELSEITPIPDASDPVWEKIVAGERNEQIKVLSLRLLLSRIQMQLRNVDDPDMRQKKIQDLRRYFVNNARALRAELKRIFGESGSPDVAELHSDRG